MTSDIMFHVLFWPFFAYSIIAHEVAHAWVAKLNGDDTADEMGRITANPIPHIDPFMSILVPVLLYISTSGAFIFGGAKPVPVNPLNFRRRVWGDISVSLAGVTANFLIAFAASLVLRLFYFINPESVYQVNYNVVFTIMLLNIILMLFNLIPIPPLDGSHVFKYLLPKEMRIGYQRIGFFGIILIIILIQIPQVGSIIFYALSAIIGLFFIDGGFHPPMRLP
jgi:Zn-dependent protease